MGEIVIYILLVIICLFVFLFVFWRGLKEDYIPSQIFSTSIVIILTVLAGYFCSSFYFKEYRFWFVILTFIIGYIIGSKRSGIKFYEGLDSLISALLLSIFISSVILYSYRTVNLFLFYISIGLSLAIYYIVKKYYKTFIWYRSGRRGFPGLFTTGVFLLTRSAISLIKPDYTLLLTEYDIFFSGLISFVSFLNIFILAKG